MTVTRPANNPGELPPLILASLSPRRKKLLEETGLPFEVVVRPVEEILDGGMRASALCLLNSRKKAEAVAEDFPHATVIAADTLVFIDNTPLGKPADEEEARRMLTQLSGRTHYVCTAVSIRSPLGRKDFAYMTDVEFRTLTPETISRYMSLVNVFDKAGAYALQEHGGLIIRRIKGDANNVIGLPVVRLLEQLHALGYPVG